MAIIQRDDELSKLPQTLLQMMVSKEQMAQAKEAQKLEKERFQMQQEAFQFEQAQRLADQEAGSALLGMLGSEAQAMAQGLSPAARARFVPQALAAQGQAAEIDLTRAQIGNMTAIQALEERRLALQDRLGTEENEIARRGLEIELQGITTQRETALDQMASQEFMQAIQLGQLHEGGITQFFQEAYGDPTVDPATIRSRMSEQTDFTPQQKLKRLLGGFRITEDTQNTIVEALFTDGVDPQAALDQFIANPEILPEDAAKLTMAFMHTFPGLTIPPPAEKGPGPMERFWAIMARLNGAGPGPRNAGTPGVSGGIGLGNPMINPSPRPGPGR